MEYTLELAITTPPMPPGFIGRNAPEGVTVTHAPMMFTRSGESEAMVELTLHISITGKVVIGALAAWIVGKFFRSKINLNPRINGKPLPPNETDAVKMIEGAIRENRGDKEDYQITPKERE